MINSIHFFKKNFLNSTTVNTIQTSTTRLFNLQQQQQQQPNHIYSYFYNNFFTKKESRKKLDSKNQRNNPNDRNKSLRNKKAPAPKEQTMKKHRRIEHETEQREIKEKKFEFDKKKRLDKLNKNKEKFKNSDYKLNEDGKEFNLKSFSQYMTPKSKLKLKSLKPPPTSSLKTSFYSKSLIDNKKSKKELEQEDLKLKVEQMIESKDKPIYTEFNRVKFRVSKDMQGMRVDRWINTKLPVLPHSLICRWLRNKAIFMENGEEKKFNEKENEETQKEQQEQQQKEEDEEEEEEKEEEEKEEEKEEEEEEEYTEEEYTEEEYTKEDIDEEDIEVEEVKNKEIIESSTLETTINSNKTKQLKRHRLKFNDKVQVGSWIYFPAQAILDQQIADFNQPEKYARLSDQEIKDIKESVIYKDEYILVLNKPQGLSVQGGTGLNKHLDMMLGHLRFEKSENPKLVHRLDKSTSGILILGRSRLAANAMAEKFELKLVKEKDRSSSNTDNNKNNKNNKNNNNNNNNSKKLFREKENNNNKDDEDEKVVNKGIKKTYWALLASTPTPKEGRIRAPLKKVVVNGEERVVPSLTTGDGAKIAITEYKVLESSLTKQCFVALWPETGRTHQLRVHCSSVLNTPIIGDTKYGNKESDENLKSILPNPSKLHLHARRIEFLHPFTNKKIDISAPLPKELIQNWKTMGFNYKFDDKFL